MERSKKGRTITSGFEASYFKPGGVSMLDLEEVSLSIEERESLRLADILGMPYDKAGLKMGISRSNFGRIIQRARKVLADALVNGKAIHIEGGNFKIAGPRLLKCEKCEYQWKTSGGESDQKVKTCPECNNPWRG